MPSEAIGGLPCRSRQRLATMRNREQEPSTDGNPEAAKDQTVDQWRRPMNSPFPGMDPYLEQFWPDLHARLMLYACDQLEEQLPGNLIARVEERVVLETEEDPHGVYPDIKITERAGR